MPAKRAFFIAVAGAGALSLGMGLVYCTPPEPGKYTNRKQGFEIRFPEGWEIKENQMGLDVTGLSPREGPSDQFSENVSIASSEMKMPLDGDAILDANISSMMRMITDFKPSERGYQDIGGVKAARLDYTQRQGQFRLSVTLYALPGRERAYLIYCTAETDAASRFSERFDTIVSSFKVNK